MRLTVGIPTYNRSGLLAETIKSVLEQTFTDFELLISDNASDDDTAEVVAAFGDERIRYSRSNENIGFLGNFRRVMELTRTEYLVILPDDDVLYRDHLRAAVEVLDCHANVGLVHTAFDFIDDQARVTKSVSPLLTDAPVVVERGDVALERLMVTDVPICFPSVVYRTEAIVGADGMRAEDGPFGDIQLWMRMALDWDFGYLAQPLAAFRVHEESVTQRLGLNGDAEASRRDVVLLQTQMRLDRRMAFLDDALLPAPTAARLRALAKLHELAERAYWGLPWRAAVVRQTQLMRAYPKIMLQSDYWRLAVANLGGRWLRRALAARRS